MAITDDLLDQLIKDYKKPEDLIGENGLLKQLTKRLLERAMQAEMTDHLGYAKNAPAGNNTGNSRNGSYKKKVKGDFGEIDLAVPRDRNATFAPAIVPKGESRFKGFDDKIISMYSRGMTTRDIQTHLEEMYGVDVSPTLISQVTEAVSFLQESQIHQQAGRSAVTVHTDARFTTNRDSSRHINKNCDTSVGAITM